MEMEAASLKELNARMSQCTRNKLLLDHLPSVLLVKCAAMVTDVINGRSLTLSNRGCRSVVQRFGDLPGLFHKSSQYVRYDVHCACAVVLAKRVFRIIKPRTCRSVQTVRAVLGAMKRLIVDWLMTMSGSILFDNCKVDKQNVQRTPSILWNLACLSHFLSVFDGLWLVSFSCCRAGFTVSKVDSPPPPDVHEQYIGLMCIYKPTAVFDYLKRSDAHFRLEQTLAVSVTGWVWCGDGHVCDML